MARRKGWLEGFLEPEVDRIERRSVEQFAAYRWNGTSLVQESVRDISPSGVYVITKERWQRGTLVTLTLQREGPLEMNADRRLDMLAKVARSGKDGVGLAFVLPKNDPASSQWEMLRSNLIEDWKPADMLSLVRSNEAISFLSQICPGGAEEIGQLLRGRLSNHKVAVAVDIVLKAHSLVAQEVATEGLHAETNLVVRILEDGSCTEEGWLKHFWGGLLATSCTAHGKDELSRALVGLFSQLTTFPVRLLVVICTRATKVLAESGVVFAKPLACKIDELTVTTGSRGQQVERDLQRLCELGLMEKQGAGSSAMLAANEVLIAPTSLGLQLFAHCNGQRGPLQQFYALASHEGQGHVHSLRTRSTQAIPINR
ncbi:PilZ domain-containing protein [Telmatobacter sp. DSM 110680]|uniref:PilZ domain-containing protein n=1 Tax=Telmatobacter sp. DSM 110680 TaxID=3036704 RepID=A0AAU7DDI3_9BACT